VKTSLSPVDKPGSNLAIPVVVSPVLMVKVGWKSMLANLTITPSDIFSSNLAMSPARAGIAVIEVTVGATRSVGAAVVSLSAATAVVPSFNPVWVKDWVKAPEASAKLVEMVPSLVLSPVLKLSIWDMAAFWACKIWVKEPLAPPVVPEFFLALPVMVSIALLVEDTAVAAVEAAVVSLVSSKVNVVTVLALSVAVFKMVVRLSELPKATEPPLAAAVLMEPTMPCATNLCNLAMVGAVVLESETEPFMAAAPMDIMLATIMALLFISMACSRVMPDAAVAVVALEVATVSIWVTSASVAKPNAELTEVRAEALASLTLTK